MLVGICDNNMNFSDTLKQMILNWGITNKVAALKVLTFENAEQFLFAWQGGVNFDIMFMEIELPHMSGYDLAKTIREKDSDVPIVFVTNSDVYLYEGYSLNILRYLKKCAKKKQINECLQIAYERFVSDNKEFISIKTEEMTIKVPVNKISHVTSLKRKVCFYMNNGKIFETSQKIKMEEVMKGLPAGRFLRCHRGFIVNIHMISMYNRNYMYLFDQTEIPIGRTYRETVLQHLSLYFQKK